MFYLSIYLFLLFTIQNYRTLSYWYWIQISLISTSNIKFQMQPSYEDQKIILNEQLFRVEGEKLLHSVIHRSIGALTFLNKNKKLCAGTGTLISRNLVLTSAHNIYDKRLNCEYSEFQFYLGANGVAKEFYEIEGWRYLEGFKTFSATDGKLQFDYALLKLKKDVEYHHFLYLSFPCDTCLMLNSPSPVVEIFGYPGSYQNFKALDKYGNQMQLYQYGLARDNRIVSVDSSAFKIEYGISTLPGQSGSPVVVGSRIIAIHNGGGKKLQNFNIGRLITLDLQHNLRKWTRQLNAQQFSTNKDSCNHFKDNIFKNVYRYIAKQSDGRRFHFSLNPQLGNLGNEWINNGPDFRVPEQGVEEVVPVYQFRFDQSQTYGGWRYFYTTRDTYQSPGWTFDGIAFYAFAEKQIETIPIYQHYYIQNDGLRFELRFNKNLQPGWINDGIVFWVYKKS